MKADRQFAILFEGYKQYAAFGKVAELSVAERAVSEIPGDLPLALIKLGPRFARLGKILNTRPDMIPDEYIRALELLQADVSPCPSEDACTITREKFRREISVLFSSFDALPMACVSLAQVHFTVLLDGTELAFQLQRPDIGERITEVVAGVPDRAARSISV